jgi:hypothetical protein
MGLARVGVESVCERERVLALGNTRCDDRCLEGTSDTHLPMLVENIHPYNRRCFHVLPHGVCTLGGNCSMCLGATESDQPMTNVGYDDFQTAFMWDYVW